MVKKYKHIWILLAYTPIYLIWFFVLEQRTDITPMLIQSRFDSMIPFNEWFIIPYLIWFPYLIGGTVYFFWRGAKSDEERRQYYQMAFFLVSGMTICLAIYTIWPNGLHLRPDTYPRQNIATRIVAALQGFDTPSNVCPSLHVYTSLVINVVICRSKMFRKNTLVKVLSPIIMTLIIVSTVFLKQHSVVDVFWALILFIVLYFVTYYIVIKDKKVAQ